MTLLATTTQEWFSTLPDEVREWPEWSLLSQDQLVAVEAICAGRYKVVNLLGRAGSGKTFTLKFAARVLEALDVEVRICGTTGVASQNAGGESTVNSLFRLGTGNFLPTGLVDFSGERRRQLRRAIEKASTNFTGTKNTELVIVIDEISMATAEFLVLVYQVMSAVSINRKFRFVLVGDLRQLLPVVAKSRVEKPWTDFFSLYFETAKFQPVSEDKQVYVYGSMLDGPFQMNGKESILPQGTEWTSLAISLVTNHRQKADDESAWFIDALNTLGDGAEGKGFNHPKVKPLRQRVWLKDANDQYRNLVTGGLMPDVDGLHIYGTNREVAAENERALASAKGKHVTYKAEEITPLHPDWTVEDVLKEIAPLEPELKLAVGLKFMVRLNLNPQLLNGTIGEIVELRQNPDEIVIKLPDGTIHEIVQTEIPMPSTASGPVARVKMFPGHLSHAMTPWKAQGLTIREPLIYHLNGWQQTHGLMYVVCSRVTEPDLLYLMVDKAGMLSKAVYCEEKVRTYIRKAERNTERLLQGQPLIPDISYECTYSDEATEQVAHQFRLDGDTYCFFYKNGSRVLANRLVGTQWVRCTLSEQILNAVEVEVERLQLQRSYQSSTFWKVDGDRVYFGPYEVELLEYVEKVSSKATTESNSDAVTVYSIPMDDGQVVYGMLVKDQAKLSAKLRDNPESVNWFEYISYIWFHPNS